ncbi:MAG: glycosyltransferase [Deltaproteobacteria bacterium]|nr:glycosyltransferase [Deltaproteobacteria bacterium]MBW2418481.1 glycosyltransferase [Deltaproteobacteria bacterium]
MRIALVHDWLTGMRGGERILHELAQMYPKAEIHTLIHVAGTTSSAIEALPIHASPLSRLPGAARHYRKLLPLFPWAIRRFDFSSYELVISCSHAFAKSVETGPGTLHLCYCMTPIRYVWDQIDAYLGRGGRRVLAAPLVAGLRRFDLRTSGPEHVTRFLSISTAVSERIRRHYGRQAHIVHPPVDTDRIRPNGLPAEDFYLLVGGFVPYKREEIVLEAFRSLDRRLVVVGDGPLRKALQARAPKRAEFLGKVGDGELAELYARCRALLYPQEEDFGIVAVEAQAAGRPVIALGSGGALDTVRPLGAVGDGSPATGLWISSQCPEAVIESVMRFEEAEGAFDPNQIRSWAERFGIARFRAAFQHEVDDLLEGGV